MKSKDYKVKEFNTGSERLPVLSCQGPGAVKVGKGHYLVYCKDFITVKVDGHASLPLTALRVAVLSEALIEVDCAPLYEWAIKEVQPFDPVDSVPHEALLSDPRPLTMEEMIRQMIRQEARSQGEDFDDFDEADDFDIDDSEDLPFSPHEERLAEEAVDDVEPVEKPGVQPTAPAESAPKAPAPQGAPTGVPPAAAVEIKPQAA